jgi:hypothetical protein
VNSKRTLVGLALPLCAIVVASACVNAPNGTSPAQATATGATSSPVPTVIGAVSASPTALPAATIDVSPAEQRVGGISLSLSFEPPRHMVDQAMVTAAAATTASNPDAAQPTSGQSTATTPAAGNKGSIVLSDMLKVTNNMDALQALPADTATTVVRHVVVGVKMGDSSQAVPYLGVSMDILLDGHPLGFGQAIVPMVAAEATVPTLYYGNNVRLGQRGTYQVFVRVGRNPLLGTDQPQAGQFNVLVR